MMTREDELFDYGCGLGDDVAILSAEGYSAWGWDPNHRPDGRRASADVVNLGFVINVIESPHERTETLKDAWRFARKGLVVSSMLTGKTDVSNHKPHVDGYLTSRQTFQRYFSQSELLQFVSETVGEQATSLGQGIVGVFRDKDLEQRVRFQKRSRAAYLTRRILPRGPLRQRREKAAPRASLMERIHVETAAIWETALVLGRMPTADEIDVATMVSLSEKKISFARALHACNARFDMDDLAAVAEARRDDLLVHMALSMFPGAQKYSSLPRAIQRDIRHFFGNHAHLAALASTELSALRNANHLQSCFNMAVDEGS